MGLFVRAAVHERAGERDLALSLVAELEAASERAYVPAPLVATLHVWLGQTERAFAWLEEAYEERCDLMCFLKASWGWGPVRSDPRFTDLVRRVGIP